MQTLNLPKFYQQNKILQLLLQKMQKPFLTPNTQLRNKYLPSPSTRKDQTYLDYIELLVKNGLQINPKCFPSFFQLKNGLEYPGIATSQKISPSQVLVKVPKKLVLSSFIASQRPQLQEVFKEHFYHDECSWQDRVINTYLLYIYGQKQTANIWYHMVEHLSKDIDIIGFWPEEDLNKFKDVSIKPAALMDRESFEKEWAEFQKVRQNHEVLQHQVFSKQNYRWIFIHLISRCFGKQLEFTSMVPFCEFFNHHAVDGHYDVQTTKAQNNLQSQDSQTSSITTQGSYMSEDYMEVGEYAYDQVQSKQYTWQCKEHLDLNQKQKRTIVNMASKILQAIESKLNWKDVTIFFVPNLIERCNLIKTEYKAGRRTFQRAHEDLMVIQKAVDFYRQNITKSYNKWRGKGFTYQVQTKKEEQKQQNKAKQRQNSTTQQDIIQFPTQEKKPYDNFLLLTGKRDQYLPPNQIYFCYGRNSNRTLLLRYGFAIEGNKYEHVWLSFDISNSLIHFPDTILKLQQKHLSLRRKFKIKINRLNMQLIMFFRLKQWSYFGQRSVEGLFKINDYSKEISILTELKKQLEQIYKRFDGNYDLSDRKLSYHQYFINVYHQQKVKIISQHMQFTSSLIKFLKSVQRGKELEKAKQQFTLQERFIFRHYLSQFK